MNVYFVVYLDVVPDNDEWEGIYTSSLKLSI